MITSPSYKLKLRRNLQSSRKSTKCRKTIRASSQPLRVLLTGLLLTLGLTISGCQSKSSLPLEQSKVTVDASLMVEPNLTTSLLKTLSQ